MVANKYAFLQITRRRFLNEWEAFKKVISRRNIRRRITIPLTLSNLKLLRRITRTENILHRNFTRRQLFLLVLILLLMPTLNFLPVWFALSLLRFRLPSRLPM